MLSQILSQKIKDLRTARNLTQVQLADRAGVTKQCVSNWENDNVQPSVDMLVKIAKILGVTTDNLLGLDERVYIDVTGLTDDQAAHIRAVADDIIRGNRTGNGGKEAFIPNSAPSPRKFY